MDFSDFIERAAGRAALRNRANKMIDAYNGNSIRKMSKDLILQFPLLVSQNLSIDTVELLANGFEVENTIMIRLLLQNDFGNLTSNSGDLITSLKMIHTNIEGNIGFLESIENANKSLSMPIEDKFCKWSLNEGTLPKYLNEDYDPRHSSYHARQEQEVEINGRRERRTHEASITFNDEAPFNPDMFKKVNDLQPTFISCRISVSNCASSSGSTANAVGQAVGAAASKLLGVNSPQSNGQYSTNRTSLVEKEIIFGVKCIAHPIKSEDIIFNIGNEFKNSTLFKFVKWTTGEYSFFKGLGEIIFDFTNMKNTGIQAAKTSNYWWYKLRKLRNENKQVFHSSMDKRNAPIKTATLILTKDEVDYIATNYRIDLSLPKFAQRIMNSLFLLNFAYVDEATKLVYLYNEPAASYDVKKFDAFKTKKKAEALNIDDIKSLFGR